MWRVSGGCLNGGKVTYNFNGFLTIYTRNNNKKAEAEVVPSSSSVKVKLS